MEIGQGFFVVALMDESAYFVVFPLFVSVANVGFLGILWCFLRISLAAVFWTFCIIFMLDDGNPASIEFVQFRYDMNIC